jgi:DNA primase
MGTALTPEQVSAIGKLARAVTVVFDGDTAGQRAAAKAIPLFVDADVDGRIARMPAGVDPDDYVRTHADGPAAFKRLVEGARPMLDQFIQDSASEATIDGRVATLDRVAELLVRVKNQTKRELYAGQLAGVLGLASHQVTRALREAANKANRPAPQPTAAAPEVVAPTKLPAEELQVLALLGRYPELVRTAEATRAGELLIHPLSRQLHRAAAEQASENGKLDVATWLDTAGAGERATIAAALMDGGLDSTNPASLLGKLVSRLEILRVDAEMSMNTRLQKEAQARGDDAALRALAVRGIELRKTKEGLRAALQRP